MYLVIVIAVGLWLLSKYQIDQYWDELAFRYKAYGDSKKTPIVVIPGLDGAVSFFEDIIPELTVNHYVIVYNIPLYKQGTLKEDYTFTYFAKELKNVLDELNVSSVSLVGESFGGIIAQLFALDYPHHTDRMVVLSSLAKTDLPSEIQWKLDNLLPIVEKIGQWFPYFAQMLFAQIHVFDVVEEHEPRFVKQLFIKEASHAHFFSVMNRIQIAAKLDIVNRVSDITAPMLIVYGEDDHFTKKDALTLHQLVKSSELKSLPGGHLCHITSPKVFSAMVTEFFKK